MALVMFSERYISADISMDSSDICLFLCNCGVCLPPVEVVQVVIHGLNVLNVAKCQACRPPH